MKLMKQRGFTLIELMVVIVIIGILAALAIPKMLGVSGKAKASEAPTAIANYETLQSAYVQETGGLGTGTNIGFAPSASKWWDTAAALYNGTAGTIQAKTGANAVGACAATTVILQSAYVVANDAGTHTKPGGSTECKAYFPNF